MNILPVFKFCTGFAGEGNLNPPSRAHGAESDKHSDNGSKEFPWEPREEVVHIPAWSVGR